jgi:hypothetical protein
MDRPQLQAPAGPAAVARDSQAVTRAVTPGKAAHPAKVILAAQALTAVWHSAVAVEAEEKHRQVLTVLVQELRHRQEAKAEMVLL